MATTTDLQNSINGLNSSITELQTALAAYQADSISATDADTIAKGINDAAQALTIITASLKH